MLLICYCSDGGENTNDNLTRANNSRWEDPSQCDIPFKNNLNKNFSYQNIN